MQENSNNNIDHLIKQISELSAQQKTIFFEKLIQNTSPFESYLIQKNLDDQHKGKLDLISYLPNDLSLLIFNNLSGQEIWNCYLACKSWHRILNNENFWKKKYFQLLHFNELDPFNHLDNMNYLHKYTALMNRGRNWSLGLPYRTSSVSLTEIIGKTMLLGPQELLLLGNDRNIKIINIYQRWSILTWRLPQNCMVFDVDWTNDLLIACPFGRECFVLNVRIGNLLGSLVDHTSLVTHGVFSEKFIITGARDHTIKLWNKENFELFFSLQLNEYPLLALKVVPDTDILLIVNVFGFIQLFDLNTLQIIQDFHPLNWVPQMMEETDNNQFKHFSIYHHTMVITQGTMIYYLQFDTTANQLHLIKVKLHSSIIRSISLNRLGLIIGNFTYNSIASSMVHFWDFSSPTNSIIPIEVKPSFSFLSLCCNNNTIILSGTNNTLLWLDFLPQLFKSFK